MRTLLILLLCLPFVASTLMAQLPDGMSGDEVMRRVIARRAEIERSTTSFAATLHTTSHIQPRNENSTLKLLPDHPLVHESIGDLYHGPEIGTLIRIYAKRHTTAAAGFRANLIGNFESLGGYLGIDDDEIILLNTSITSPLAENAFEYYSFEVREGPSRSGVPVYQITLHPTTTLYPVFVGKLVVAQKSFDLMEVDLSPSERTAVPFIDTLRLTGTFSPVEKGGSYQPELFELSGRARVRGIAFGLAEPEVEFRINGSLDRRRLNVPVPDSIRMQLESVVVTAGADSVGEGFWSRQGKLSVEQVRAMKESETQDVTGAPASLSVSGVPYIDYNRAGAVSLGASGSASYGPVTLGAMGGYSFGLARPITEVSVAVALRKGTSLDLTLRGGTFSQIATTTTGDKSYPRFMNTLVSATLHQDYYNFYRKDGWSVGADVVYDPLRLGVTLESSRQFSIDNNARWSVLTFSKKEFQPNPPITEGSYQTVQADLNWGRVAPFLKFTPIDKVDLRWSLTGMFGANRSSDTSFRLVEALASLSIPTLRTGYNPMVLTLLGAAGVGTASLPPQYQFRLRTSAASFGKAGGFVSPPKGLYGGTEYLALGAEFNTTDFLWRASGLPTYNGHGLELILAGGSARYLQRHPVGYIGTGDQWYSEVGFALGRIPLFITDLVVGRADIRWGLGPLGKVNANITFMVPL